MNRTLPKLLAGLALSSLVLLSGCGGSDESTGSEPPAGGQPSASADAPSTESQPSEAPSSEESSESADGGSDEAKPSKDEVVAGLAKFYEEEQALSKKDSKKFAECMMDEMYDKASAKSLIAMKDGEPTKMDGDDVELLAEAGTKCAKVLAGG